LNISFREPGKKLEYGETRMSETMQADEVAVDLLSKSSIQGQQKNKHISQNKQPQSRRWNMWNYFMGDHLAGKQH
jgi:hypothetical protein